MSEVSSIKIRRFHIFRDGSRPHEHDSRIQDIRRGDTFRADDESMWNVWLAKSDPYLNIDDIWTIEAELIAG